MIAMYYEFLIVVSVFKNLRVWISFLYAKLSCNFRFRVRLFLKLFRVLDLNVVFCGNFIQFLGVVEVEIDGNELLLFGYCRFRWLF